MATLLSVLIESPDRALVFAGSPEHLSENPKRGSS
jgi:hypothetical protein